MEMILKDTEKYYFSIYLASLTLPLKGELHFSNGEIYVGYWYKDKVHFAHRMSIHKPHYRDMDLE
jgi:hypothetical protein